MSETRIVYGFHAVTSRLRQDATTVEEIYLDNTRRDARVQDLSRAAAAAGVRVLTMDSKRLDGLTGGLRHQGVAARVRTASVVRDVAEVLTQAQGAALLIVLDGVQDPHNLGACLRVADAFGVHALIAPKDRAVGVTPAVSKVASGGAESVPYIAVTNLARTLRELKDGGVWIIGADEDGDHELFDVKLSGPVAWVFGAEGDGMRRLTRESCDERVRIPMSGRVESLNVSVACGICVAETIRQRRFAG